MCITCLNHCKKCKKDFDLLSFSDDEMYSSPEKTLVMRDEKNTRSDKVMHKESRLRSHRNKPVERLHHYRPEHSSTCYDGTHSDRVEDQPKTHQHHYSSGSSKMTCEDTKAHDPEKHSKLKQATRHGRQKHQRMENRNLSRKGLPRPHVVKSDTTLGYQGGGKKRSCFPLPLGSSSSTFSHHHSSRFSALTAEHDQRSCSKASSFTHRSLHPPSGPFPTQYCHDNKHITVQQPAKSHPLQHSSNVPSRMLKKSEKPAEGHSYSLHTTKSNAPSAHRSHRDASHYKQHSKSTVPPPESLHHKMQASTSSSLSGAQYSSRSVEHDQCIVESSGSSISPEEIGGTHPLHYTTSATGIEKVFSLDEYYSPTGFDRQNDDIIGTQASMSTLLTRSSNSFIPIRPTTTDKILSSTDNFDLISLSSSTS